VNTRGRKTLERAREGTKPLLLQTRIPSEHSIYNSHQLNIHTRSISSGKMDDKNNNNGVIKQYANQDQGKNIVSVRPCSGEIFQYV